MRVLRKTLLIIAVVSTSSTSLGAQGGGTPQPAIKTFTFDHYLQKDGGSSVTELSANEEFRIVLAHTCEEAFEYSIYKSPHVDQRAARAAAGAPAPGGPRNPSGTVTKGPIAHEPKWGSYILQVKRKPSNPATCDVWVDSNGTPAAPPASAHQNRADTSGGGHWVQDVEFKDAMYVVAVETQEWDVGADAALAFTTGVDKKYTTTVAPVAQGQTPDPSKKVVIEDVDGESSGRISFGTLTHFYFPGTSTGPSIGFSILSTQNNQTEYYFGWGFGVGPRSNRLNAALGAAYAPVPTLPAGVSVNQQLADGSTLPELRSVYKWRFFFSLSATLFRTGDSAGKPPAPNP